MEQANPAKADIIRKPSRRRKKRTYLRNNYEYYLMLLPAAALYIIFRYVPINGLLMAFENYNFMVGVFKSHWVWFSVFADAFRQSTFWQAFFNTIWLNLLSLLIQFPIPIIFTLLLNEVVGRKFKRTVQTISYMPHFISWVIIYGVVLAFVNSDTGLINLLLKSIGVKSVEFLTVKGWWVFIYVFTGVWKETGWSAIIYLAALGSINPELYEAAEIDGANRLGKMWHVTLPGIKGTIVILLLLSIGGMISIGFEQPWLFGNALVSDISSVLSTYIYTRGITQAQFSYATAVGLFQQVVNFILLLLANYSAKLLGEEGLFNKGVR